jgi:hypothetical protein
MRLLNLCDEAQEALENNQISERHARSLLQLKNIDDQRNVLEKIINERMTVKTTENVIKEIIQNNSLDSTKEVIDNNVSSYPLKEDNIYGNDIVNITELNKKELEKESENMNNNEQNMQFNAQNTSMDAMASQPTVEANPTSPAFGDRFFPSLEDQPTNVNLNNPFGTIPTPAPTPVQQPMMENLVDPTPVVNNVYEQQPVMPTPEQVPTAPMPESVSIPTFITNEQMVQPTVNPLENMASNPNMDIPNTVETQIPNVEQPTPVIPNDFIATPPQTPAGFEIPQPINNTFTEPSIPETNTITPPPVIDPTNNTVSSPQPMMPPVEQIPSEVTPIEAISPVQAPTSPVEPSVENAVIPPVENKTNDNIINAINAIKNLALSIESIGYKLTINEENTPNTYKINIELEK